MLSSLGGSPKNIVSFPLPHFALFLPSLFPSAHHSCVFIFHSKRSSIAANPGVREVIAYNPRNNADYDPATFENDIAVAKLAAFSKYPPLRIQTPELSELSEPGKTVTYAGWGATVSAKIMMACMPALSNHAFQAQIHYLIVPDLSISLFSSVASWGRRVYLPEIC